MKKAFFALMAIFMTVSTLSIASEAIENETYNLSINDAINLAYQNNLGLEIEKINYAEKKWANDTSWQIFIPDTSVSVEVSQYNEPVSTGGSGSEINGSIVGTLSLSFTFNAKMIYDIRQISAMFRNGEITLNLAKRNLALNIKKAYLNLNYLYRNIVVIEETLHIAKMRVEQADKLYDNKLIAELDKLKIIYSYESLLPGLMDAENKFTDALSAFKLVLGIKTDFAVNFTDALAMPEKTVFMEDELINSFLEKNLDMKLIESNISIKEIEKKKNTAALTPSLKLAYTADPTFQGYDPLGSDWGTWFDSPSNWLQEKGEISLMLILDLDALLPWSDEFTKIREAEWDIKRYRLSMQNFREQKIAEIKSLVGALKYKLSSIDTTQKNLDITKKIYDLSVLSFEKGTVNVMEVYDAQQDLFNAKTRVLKEILDFNIYFMELDSIVN